MFKRGRGRFTECDLIETVDPIIPFHVKFFAPIKITQFFFFFFFEF